MAKISAHGDRALYRFRNSRRVGADMIVDVELVITMQGRVLRKHRTVYADRTNKWSGYTTTDKGLRDSERVMYIKHLRESGWEERKA